MKKHLSGVFAALALAILLSGPEAHAQTLTGNLAQPPVSPYINVLRGGAPAGVNYYNIVQPQLQFYSAINQLQSQQQQQALGSMGSLGYQTTGHPVQFYNYSHFYPQPGFGTRGSMNTGFSSGLGASGSMNMGFQSAQNQGLQNQTRSAGTSIPRPGR